MRVIDLALKDLLQIVRDRQSAMFLLVMPIAFTLMFGFAFGGFSDVADEDPRLPVGFVDQDQSPVSASLAELLASSQVIRLVADVDGIASVEQAVEDGELAAAVVAPAGYGQRILEVERASLELVAAEAGTALVTIEGEVGSAASRLSSAVRAAQFATESYEQEVGFANERERNEVFGSALARGLVAWREPPVGVVSIQGAATAVEEETAEPNSFAQTSPGMMAQFSIAGLMSAAAVLVLERKSRALRRLLTTTMSRPAILLGHYLAMFALIFVQLVLLILFAQAFLRLDYLAEPLATLLMTVATALFAASLGLLIGALARTEEQVNIFGLIFMFVLAGLGGAWVPLEITPEQYQRFAYLTPVAWVMDGFQDIVIRGLGLEAIWTAAGVLSAFAAVVFGLAVWRFRFE